MSQPPLESTPIITKTKNATTSHLDSTTIRTKTPDPKTLTQPTNSSKRKKKVHLPEDPESGPSLSDSSWSKSDSSYDSKYRKSKIKGHFKNKKRRKRTKQESSDSSSSDSDFPDKIDYRCERRNKKKSHQKKHPIKLGGKLTTKFLTTEYKLKIIKLKLDEHPLQSRIYCFTFVKSLETIFPSKNKLVKYS